jgi:subtilisin family serine protease
MSRLRRALARRSLVSTAAVYLLVTGLALIPPSIKAGVIGHVPDRVLLKFKPGVSETEAQGSIASNGGVQKQEIPHIGVRLLSVPAATLSKVLSALSHDPRVEFAGPDMIVAPALVPNDPGFSGQWHLAQINAPAAWDVTTGSASVIVAILDTGVDGTHPDLAANLVPGWNTYDNNSNSADVYGHGTKVAGTVAACGNNGLGVASVAFGCKLMPVRISDTSGYGYASTIASGLTWAADHGARVANVSYEFSDDPTVSSAAKYFNSKGGVVTMSAGNDGAVLTIPDNPNILTVSATDGYDALPSWSNTGTPIDLAAPGVSIYTTTVGGGYESVSGTSFSAPTAAGVAALVISANPSLSSSQIQQVLKQSADDLGSPGWDPAYGWGRVNAQRAVTMAISSGQTPGWTNQIWGRVLWAGQPVSGAIVSTQNGTNVTQATTSSDGSYVLKNLGPTTTYNITCSKTGLTFTPQFTNPLPLGFGNVYGADFYADQPTLISYTVSGRVTDPVNGAAGAEVRGGGMVVTTDASGNYQFTNFLNGSYSLTARKDFWAFSPATVGVNISSANSGANNFARVAPYSISGNIYGVPAAGSSPMPLIYLSNGNSVSAVRKGSGQNRYWGYTLNNVPAGQYSLSAELPGYSIIPQGFTVPLTVNGSLSGLNFTGSVAAVAGSLSGRITRQGLPVAGVKVQATQSGSVITSLVTDSDGYYRIANLASGSYALVPSLSGYSFSPSTVSVTSVPSGGNDFTANGPNSLQAITSATASPSVVSNAAATTTLAAAANGNGTLTYSWDAVSGSAPVSFSSNDSSNASSTTVSFQAAGNYTFRVRTTDGNGLLTTANVNVTVVAGPGPMAISPYQVQLGVGQKSAFRADAWDQVGNRVSVSPTWSVNGGGTIDGSGIFSAAFPGGPYAITATGGGISATSYVWVAGSSTTATPPLITSQPRDQAIAAGSTAAFSVLAGGTAPLTYQWFLNGAIIPGATGTSFVLTNVQPANAGTYSVQVANAAGTVPSSNAVLTVLAPPAIITQPSCLAVAAGSNAAFSLKVNGTSPMTYQWLLNGATIIGATNSSYTRTNSQTADGGNYSVQVANAVGTTTSSNASLTVNNPPVLKAINNQIIHAGATLLLTNSASDSDLPAQTLSFGLDPGSPAGASIDPASGLFLWTTTAAQAGTTNPVTVRVTDNGAPALSAARSFTIMVIGAPAFRSITARSNSVTFSWSAIAGTTYRVQYKSGLSDPGWVSLSPDVVAADSTAWFTNTMASPQRFYRVLPVP